MQIETQLDEIYNIGNDIPTSKRLSPEQEKTTYRADIQAMIDMAEKLGPKIKHDKPKWKDLPDKRKIELCTRNTGIFGIGKMIDGKIKYTPHNCNLCPKCLKANTLKLKERVNSFKEITESSEKQGTWRKKVVNEGTEVESLKKHIKRNQDDYRFEVSSSQDGKTEVWSYVKDEPGKDMDKIYGKPADPEKEIDFEDLYARNRSTGKRLTIGSGFKKNPMSAKKEDTLRIVTPAFIINNPEQQEKAAKIIEETNYIEEAQDAEHAIRLYTYQFKYILQELKKANIEISAINTSYYNMPKSDVLKSWNGNINAWMSIYGSLLKNREPNMDIVPRLIFPEVTSSAMQ